MDTMYGWISNDSWSRSHMRARARAFSRISHPDDMLRWIARMRTSWYYQNLHATPAMPSTSQFFSNCRLQRCSLCIRDATDCKFIDLAFAGKTTDIYCGNISHFRTKVNPTVRKQTNVLSGSRIFKTKDEKRVGRNNNYCPRLTTTALTLEA
jgi:hypothetical protein